MENKTTERKARTKPFWHTQNHMHIPINANRLMQVSSHRTASKLIHVNDTETHSVKTKRQRNFDPYPFRYCNFTLVHSQHRIADLKKDLYRLRQEMCDSHRIIRYAWQQPTTTHVTVPISWTGFLAWLCHLVVTVVTNILPLSFSYA